MINTQNRDGLPASIAEEQRFFELHSFSKTATPAGWNTPANWKTLDEIPEGRPFGYAVGNNSTKLLIDYDHAVKGGKVVPWMKEVVMRLRRVCSTYFETSMSETGYHQIADLGDYADNFAPESNGYNSIIVDMPIDEYRALPKEERDKVPKIEFWFKTEGRYVVLTGKHKTLNEVARDESAAALFHELLKIRQEMREKHRCQSSTAADESLQGIRFEIDEVTRKRVLEALSYISADCSREEWIHVGIALHHCGFPFEVWDTWSQMKDQRTGEASDKYVEGETQKIWKSFENNQSHWNAGTIISMAKKCGYSALDVRDFALEDNQREDPAVDDVNLVSLEDVEEKEVEWLIDGWIPKNSTTLLGGDGGAGKTTVWCDLVAKISAGKTTMLDGGYTERRPAKTMFFSSEDSADTVLKKKLRSAGGNMANIYTLDLSHEQFNNITFANGGLLEALISRYRPELCVFDPVQQFIPGNVKMAERNAMRRCLAPLKGLSERYGVTFIIVVHTNKRDNAYGRKRLADSADLWDFARSVLMIGETGEGKNRYLSQEKNSYAEQKTTVLFKLTSAGVEYRGTSPKKDRDFILQQNMMAREPSPQRIEAEEIINEVLNIGEPMELNELKETVLAAGVSESSYKRTKAAMLKANKLKQSRVGSGRGKGAKFYIEKCTGLEFAANDIPEEFEEDE